MQRHCVLLRTAGRSLIGVIADPFDPDLQTWLDALAKAGATIVWRCRRISRRICRKQEESARAVDNLVSTAVTAGATARPPRCCRSPRCREAASPAVKLVNSTLYDALKAGASDIHLESTANGLAVKYRVDGVLDHAASANGIELAEQVISRLKVLAELDIAERRVPQDGSFRVEAGGREIDLRVSIMPSIHGEDAVIRILDKRAMIEAYGALTLEALGFDAPSLTTLARTGRGSRMACCW